MADYDVGAVSLSVPPASAVVTSYRPAVLVRNNGLHPALAVGTIRIYTAGSVIFSSDIYSATIQPGATAPAQADKYWTPAAVGQYMVIAYVTCDKDQVEPNNSLAPVIVNVTNAAPPPPPTVTIHAAQHEEGGTDELNIDGLPGQTKETQLPSPHAADHEAAGADVLNVAGLAGVLLENQPPKSHAATHAPNGSDPIGDFNPGSHHAQHENDGSDEISLTGLSGVTASPQVAIVHNDDRHNVAYEKPINKDTPGGYPGLDSGALIRPASLSPVAQSHLSTRGIRYLDDSQGWRVPFPEIHASNHETGGDDELSVQGLHGQLADAQPMPDHATRHQAGGADELNVNGLSGVLTDQQHPTDHHLTHGPTGGDPINVNGLHGTLADPQPMAAHKSHHEAGGDDELSVQGLRGELADLHGNTRHNCANPGETQAVSPNAGTSEGSSLRIARADHKHPGCGGFSYIDSPKTVGITPTQVFASTVVGMDQNGDSLSCELFGTITGNAAGSVVLTASLGVLGTMTAIGAVSIPVTLGALSAAWHARVRVCIVSPNIISERRAIFSAVVVSSSALVPTVIVSTGAPVLFNTTLPRLFTLTATHVGSHTVVITDAVLSQAQVTVPAA